MSTRKVSGAGVRVVTVHDPRATQPALVEDVIVIVVVDAVCEIEDSKALPPGYVFLECCVDGIALRTVVTQILGLEDERVVEGKVRAQGFAPRYTLRCVDFYTAIRTNAAAVYQLARVAYQIECRVIGRWA